MNWKPYNPPFHVDLFTIAPSFAPIVFIIMLCFKYPVFGKILAIILGATIGVGLSGWLANMFGD